MFDPMLRDPPKQDASNSFRSRSATDVESENGGGPIFEQLLSDQGTDSEAHDVGSKFSAALNASEETEDAQSEQALQVSDDVLTTQILREAPRESAEIGLVNFEQQASQSLDKSAINIGRPRSEIRAAIDVSSDQETRLSANDQATDLTRQTFSTGRDGTSSVEQSGFLEPDSQQQLGSSGTLSQTKIASIVGYQSPVLRRAVTTGMSANVTLAADPKNRHALINPMQPIQNKFSDGPLVEAEQAAGIKSRQANVAPGSTTEIYPSLPRPTNGSASSNALQLGSNAIATGPMNSARSLASLSPEGLTRPQERSGPSAERGLVVSTTAAQRHTAQRSQQAPSVSPMAYAQLNIEGVSPLADQGDEQDFGRPPEQAQFFGGQTQPLSQPLPPGAAAALLRQLPQFAHDQLLQNKDILLNPVELGRVRLNVQASEASVHLSIMVERPETLDLIRRHINLLTAEFRSLGYHDVSFEFSQDQKQGGQQLGDSDTEETGESIALEADDSRSTSTTPHQLGGSLDLRI